MNDKDEKMAELPQLPKRLRKRKRQEKWTFITHQLEEFIQFILEQDHARCHDANLTQDWCRDEQNLPAFLDKDGPPPKMDDI